ncbi:TPA: hypothetical protein UMT89_000052 [Stenotrophomonas maltophilia]|nr:hypothetical protein [Stenotrophomonas maltophilia]
MEEQSLNGRCITTRDAALACAVSGVMSAALSWLIFSAPGGVQIAEDAGSAADWMSALGGCVAAVAAIVIGRAAHTFTVEAEEGRRADLLKEQRRIDETISARLRVMRNTAKKAMYPAKSMDTLFRAIADLPHGPRGPEIEGIKDLTNSDRREREAVRMQIEMTLRYLDAMEWSDEFKTALDEPSIDALFEMERLVLWYRTMATQKVNELTIPAPVPAGGGDAGSVKAPYDAATDRTLPAVRHIAHDLNSAAITFIAAIEHRKRQLQGHQ